jgi:DNA replication protein DnaC
MTQGLTHAHAAPKWCCPRCYLRLAEQSGKEGWPAARFLAALAEHEIADRGRRRIERHLAEARLPVGRTLASFDFEVVPMVSKAQVMALTSGDSWLEKGANLLLFGPPGAGKSHLAAAIGLALVENGWRVLFMRTTYLVQRLQIARREITANQPFGAWSKVFPDQAMTLAAIDRLVHHSTILEMNVESYRRRAALEHRGRSRRAKSACEPEVPGRS